MSIVRLGGRISLVSAAILAVAAVLHAQAPAKQVFYFPKLDRLTPYLSPMKPHVSLEALKQKHKGDQNWSELVVSDFYNRVQVISAAPGSKVPLHLHSDSPEYWFVEQGEIRFQIFASTRTGSGDRRHAGHAGLRARAHAPFS